jgi:hypothetical protein
MMAQPQPSPAKNKIFLRIYARPLASCHLWVMFHYGKCPEDRSGRQGISRVVYGCAYMLPCLWSSFILTPIMVSFNPRDQRLPVGQQPQLHKFLLFTTIKNLLKSFAAIISMLKCRQMTKEEAQAQCAANPYFYTSIQAQSPTASKRHAESSRIKPQLSQNIRVNRWVRYIYCTQQTVGLRCE